MNDILEYLRYTDKNLWESQRLLAFIDSKSHFKNIEGYDSICKFAWEEENKEEIVRDIEITNEEINRLKELAKQWEN